MGGITTTIDKVKYIGIASLTIAILSILILNIISSYSSSSTLSNAESVGSNSSNVSTQANDSSSSSISLSFSNATGSCSDTSNPANVCMSIPDNGGIATGGHTVTVNAGNDIASYGLKLSSKTEETALVNEDKGSSSSTTTIEPIISTYNGASGSNGLQSALANESDNSWAYSVDPRSVAGHIEPGYVAPLPPISQPAVILSNSTSTGTSADSINIYYGARVDNPATMLAGNYTNQVVYTVTATLHEPTIASISPTTYELGSNEGLDSTNRLPVTITGNYLSSTSRVYLTNSNTTASNTGTEYDCTNIQVASDGKSLTCTLPTDKTNPDLEAGTYNLAVLADNGAAVLDNAFTYTKASICRNADPDSDCQVDIDDNMFPVAYDESVHSWYLVSKSSMEREYGSWYDYGDRKWANAVTMPDNLDEYCYYANKGGGTYTVALAGGGGPCDYPDRYDIKTPFELASAYFNGEDIDCSTGNITMAGTCYISDFSALGFWVYIPRYVYQVMRRDATDKVVTDEEAIDMGGFNIRFETNKDTKKVPVACSSSNSNQYYQDCSNVSQDYGAATGTAWATHPAFTWQYTQDINGFDKTYELNGFWIGKFETTGTRTAPTVKPNQHANISEYIGEFYSAAKSIGVEDKNNQYGGASSDNTTGGLKQNSHNLAISTSHMLKNSEWGAVAYLSASKYGAGVNGTQINSAYPTSSADADGTSSSYGITGCGPSADGSTDYYPHNNNVPAGTPLDENTIESPTACSTDTRYAYNGSIGILASTTNTVYGIYDMSGGAYEYVMGNLTGYDDQSETGSGSYMTTQAKPPYVDLYKESLGFDYSSSGYTNPDWSTSTSTSLYNNDVCTWGSCGGHALHETKQYQSVSSGGQSWGGVLAYFVGSGGRWFRLGGYADHGYGAGLFHSGSGTGYSGSISGFRSALQVKP